MRTVSLVVILLSGLLASGCPRAPSSKDEPTCGPGRELQPIPWEEDTVFDLGPYLMHTTTESAVVMWRSLEAGPSVVEFGTGAEADQVVKGPDNVTLHEVKLTGLQADTRYVYRVRTGSLVSALHHLQTAPGPLHPLRFTVVGDTQGHPEISGPIYRSMAEWRPHLVLHVGDTVSDGMDFTQYPTQFLNPLRPLGAEVPTYVAIGNHDRQSPLFFDLVSYPNDTQYPYRESTYAFTSANTFFLVVDTQQLFFPLLGTENETSQWIRAAVTSDQAKNATWRVALGHVAGYSEGWSPGGCDDYDGMPAIREFLLPLLAENKFHLYLAGHTHAYERGFKDGILQVITGGGGGELDEWCRDFPHVTRWAAVHHHLEVQAGCDALELNTIDMDGGRIDHVVLRTDQPGVMAEEDPAPDGGTP